LHLHLPNALCFWLLFSPYCRRIPWVVHWHSDIIGDKPDWRLKLLYPLYALFEKALLKKSAVIVTTSPNYLASSKPLQKWLSKCHSIPLGIANKPTTHSDKCRLTSERIHILCVGRFTYYKAQINLLKAVKALTGQNKNVHLTLVGDGEDKNKLALFIAENGLSSNCKILSGLSDEELEQQLVNCDVLCLPSIERTEAFGVVLLEAMRAEKPCICTSVKGSGMSYVVNDNETGFVVKPSDIQAISEAIEKYISTPELLKKHGVAGRKRFEDHFEISRTTKAFSELNSRILS